MQITTTIIVAVLLVVAFWLVGTYNRFVTLRNRVKESWSDIEVQLRRRYDLIPNIVNTVKGYAKHEESTLNAVTQARTQATQMNVDPSTASPEEMQKFAEAQGAISSGLGRLLAIAENYPDLKASANFLELQRELSDTENKLQSARRFYNSTVTDMNNKVEQFPSNVLAGMFGFAAQQFFDVDDTPEARENVEVKF